MNRKTRSSIYSWPWWTSATAAAILYCVLTYLFPAIPATSSKLQNLLDFGPKLAPVLTIPLLLIAGAQLYENTDKSEQSASDTATSDHDEPVRDETDSPP